MNSHENILRKTLTIIVAPEGKNLYPLTRTRPLPLMPIGGVFRLVDFPLSNCWSSGLRRVFAIPGRQGGLVVQYLNSLDWDGNLISVYPDSFTRYGGTAAALFHNLGLLRVEGPEYVLVLSAGHVYNMDYGKLLQFHADHGGEVTIASFGGSGGIDIGAYVFNSRALRKALLVDALSEGTHDIDESFICRTVGGTLGRTINKVAAADAGLVEYWGSAATIEDYYRTQFNFIGEDDCGCGVLSPGVEIAPAAVVRSSILLSGARIGRGARVRRAIVEENVVVPDGEMIGVDAERDKRRFVVTPNGIIVVDREALKRAGPDSRLLVLRHVA